MKKHSNLFVHVEQHRQFAGEDCGSDDEIKSVLTGYTFDVLTYREIFSTAYEACKQIEEGEEQSTVIDELVESLTGENDNGTTISEEFHAILGYLRGIFAAVIVLHSKAEKLIRDKKAFMDNPEYATFKSLNDALTRQFFEPVKKIQYTTGKTRAEHFSDFIMYGALLDLKDTMHRMRGGNIRNRAKEKKS